MAEYQTTSHPFKRGKNGKPASCGVHVRVWLEAGNEIPEGFIIHHIDGDKHNNLLENLECISRSDHAKIHWAELKKTRQKEINETMKWVRSFNKKKC